jgi:hypothetical protein
MRRLHEQPQVARLLLQEVVQLDGEANPELNGWLKRFFTPTDAILARVFPEVEDNAQIRLVWVAMLNMALGLVTSTPLLSTDDGGLRNLSTGKPNCWVPC